MMRGLYFTIVACVCLAFVLVAGPNPAAAASAAEIDHNSRKALEKLYVKSSKAKELSKTAVAILVFPNIVKAGLIVGGQYGEGELIRDGAVVGYYNTVSGSYGLQAGIQKYGYALFFMTEKMLAYLDKSGGWELGTAPNIVVVDKGAATGISTTSAQSDAYAFFFDPKGLMAGLGLQGTKITKINK
ncbi:MAG TPA: lipid-binding SYLF domain-containing protein [Syntrophorhabdales bacterium]|nr:lipid-binding SYLF domain-containing protein [Syntrophorhabdales bacterium]